MYSKSMQYLFKELAAEEKTFMYYLHERSQFYLDQYTNMTSTIETNINTIAKNEYITKLVIDKLCYVMNAFYFHIDKNDAYKIENVSENFSFGRFVNEIRELIDKIVEAIFNNKNK